MIAGLALLASTSAWAEAPRACDAYAAEPIRIGEVPPLLHELSGLAASRQHPGIFWAHNDSGNSFTLYALRENGTVAAAFPLGGARPVDIEDVAIGPCGRGAARICVYLADIGDNGSDRALVRILKLPEPDELRARPLGVEPLPFRYADGPRNAEAILVDPHTAEVFVLSKSFLSLGDVYRLDGLGKARVGTAVRVAAIVAPSDFGALTTAASVHPSGERLLLRTYGGAWELRRRGARSLAELFDAEPVRVPSAHQGQAEAITYTRDGSGYVLGGEGAASPLFRVRCADR